MKYWYYGDGSTHYYAYSNVLGEFFWYRFDNGVFLEAKGYEIDIANVMPLERGFMPKCLRKKAFLCEHGDAWLNALVEKDTLVLSAEKTLDLAVLKLGRPIERLYELPPVRCKRGAQRRWKLDGEMVEQNNGGALFVSQLTKARPRDLPGKYGQFYYVKGFDAEPNVCFYLFEERDGVHRVRYERSKDGIETASMVGYDVVGYPMLVCEMDVPEIVRARRFAYEHGIEWLRKRCLENDGLLDRDGLVLLATLLNRPIWPWQIRADGSTALLDKGDYVVCSWVVDNAYRVHCNIDLNRSGASRWMHGFVIEKL